MDEKEYDSELGKTTLGVGDEAGPPNTKVGIGARPACFRSTFVEILYVLTCTMAVAMPGFLQGSVQVTTNYIAEDLHMNQAKITWVVAAANLTTGSFLLFFGRLTDLFGRKIVIIASLFFFAVVCLGAGFSQDGLTLDVINGLLGLFCASVIPPAQGSLGTTYDRPSKRKNYAFACFSAGNPLGFVFGSLCSGAAATIFNWRASFWLLAIIYLVFSILACFTVPADTTEKLSLNKETMKRFDFIGAILTIASIGMFTCALSQGGVAPQGWKMPYVLVLLILGLALLAVFILWELKYPYPLMPMWIWKDRDLTILTIIISTNQGVFAATLFWITLYMQDFWTGSSLHVAAYILPSAISGILANIVAGAFLHKIPGRWMMGIACSTYTIAFVLLGCNRMQNGYWPFVFPALAIITWATDLEFNVVNMYILTKLPQEQQGIAGGIFQMVTRVGVTVVLGLTTAIFNAVDVPRTGFYGGDVSVKYAATYWFGTAVCVASVALIPLLKVGTQGNEVVEEGERQGEKNGSEKESSRAEDQVSTDKG